MIKRSLIFFLCVKLCTYPSMDLSSFDSSAKKTKKKIVKKKLADINQTFQTVQKTSYFSSKTWIMWVNQICNVICCNVLKLWVHYVMIPQWGSWPLWSWMHFLRTFLKFMFSKKATKIGKIFTIDLTVTTYCQIGVEDFANFCGLLRKHEL